MVEINRDKLKSAYLAFMRDIEVLAVKLERSDFGIYRPFNNFKARLEKYEAFDKNRLRFMNWCTEYENDIRSQIQAVSECALVVDIDNCWDVYMIPSLAHVPVSEYFNILAHECCEYISKEIHFGTLDSPLEFDDFVNHFSKDMLETVYWQLEHGRFGIQEGVLSDLDSLVVVCYQLDLLGKREDTFEYCKRTVFRD